MRPARVEEGFELRLLDRSLVLRCAFTTVRDFRPPDPCSSQCLVLAANVNLCCSLLPHVTYTYTTLRRAQQRR